MFHIVTTINTKKKQPMSDDESADMYDIIHKQVRDTGKKTHPTQTTKNKDK